MQPERPVTDPAVLAAELDAFSGSLERYRHWTRRLIYTPGVEHLATAAEAFWLIDAVASHQHAPSLKGESFQVWTLKVDADRSGELTCDDGNGNVLLRQTIPWTSFPMDTVTVWLIDGTLLLPSEY